MTKFVSSIACVSSTRMILKSEKESGSKYYINVRPPLSMVKHNVNMSIAWRDSITRFLTLHWSQRRCNWHYSIIIIHWIPCYCKWETKIYRILSYRNMCPYRIKNTMCETTNHRQRLTQLNLFGRTVQFYSFISFRQFDWYLLHIYCIDIEKN